MVSRKCYIWQNTQLVVDISHNPAAYIAIRIYSAYKSLINRKDEDIYSSVPIQVSNVIQHTIPNLKTT